MCMQTLIHKLEFGKSAGPDGICVEALKCAHDQLSVLCLCFTLFLSHGYLPPKLIETTIKLLLKICVETSLVAAIIDQSH